MTSFWLFLGSVFTWTFGFFDFAGNFLNWVLFIVASGFFIYWCYILVVTLGGDKDKEYHSETEGKFPYYDPKLYKNEG
ncbi:hypothetical protein [Soonwooa purpurea]